MLGGCLLLFVSCWSWLVVLLFFRRRHGSDCEHLVYVRWRCHSGNCSGLSPVSSCVASLFRLPPSNPPVGRTADSRVGTHQSVSHWVASISYGGNVLIRITGTTSRTKSPDARRKMKNFLSRAFHVVLLGFLKIFCDRVKRVSLSIANVGANRNTRETRAHQTASCGATRDG